ncbi:MAG: hypothetical protein JO149_05290, partial [Gammaproteobacteria bacterium]|nr:hypothetical protein [Gammaproteobacteria bacterium]
MSETNFFFQQFEIAMTVVTPNRRLAASLSKLYHQHQLAQQTLCWQTPDILPLSTWIERSFNQSIVNEFNARPYLLNNLQEQFLWEKILTHSKESEQLLQIADTAVLVQSSWSLLKQWCIDINDPIFNSAEDYAALQQWIKQFQTLCQKEHWITQAELPAYLIEKINTKKISVPPSLMLVGFTEISPQLNHLLSTYQKNDCRIK